MARSVPRPASLRIFARLAAAIVALALVLPAATLAAPATRTYTNPLRPTTEIGTGVVESCADPTAIYGQENERLWFMYCTADPLNDQDKTGADFNFRQIPMFSSPDLVHWTYRGEAFAGNRPVYATPTAGLWAPEIVYHPENGKYYLYYTVTETTFEGDGSAIGVATSDGPLGPWTHSASPVVEPHAADCCPGSRRWVFDPEVQRTVGPDYIYYGSYFGGISVRTLSEDGFTSTPIDDGDPTSATKNVAVANKFEGAEVEKIGDYYYLFASATDCCRGPLTGYVVMVGRSLDPTGPFVDKDGVRLDENEGDADPTNARVGGTPVIYQNGNRWIGTGHNTVFQDFAGQWWTIYHAVDINHPYFAGAPGFTKRPALLDRLTMVGGWPMLNGGRGPSDTPQPAPAAQPGEKTSHAVQALPLDRPTTPYKGLSDNFNNGALSAQWSWVRQPAAGTYGESGGVFWMNTQAADLFESSNNASVLVESAPNGNWVAETKVRLNVPAEGCCFNFVQAGLVAYGDDDNFIKLTNTSIFNTRQTEYAKEVGPVVPTGYPRYGNTVVGAPGEWTWLRIVKRPAPANAPGGLYGGNEAYTAYTSRDGSHWTRGGTWLHHLGQGTRIGLVAMGGSGFRAEFDYVRVSKAHVARR
jgi:arabinan endo-1,5-alpha-L-arabinosidase